MIAAQIAAALGESRRAGRWWSCRCPAHDDRSPSLSLRDGNRGVFVHCWAGCDPRDVLAALRLRGLIAGGSDGASLATAAVVSRHSVESIRRLALARRIW